MKRKYSRLMVAAVFAVLLIGGLVSFTRAKYVTVINLQGKVTVTARLADSVEVLEHKAVPQGDGSYVLKNGAKISESETLPNETVTLNQYDLLPGLDIPKDPFIRIKGKTPIEAYLFVEVVDKMSTIEIGEQKTSPLTYQLSSNWMKLDVSGANGGTVYVYIENEMAKVFDEDDNGDFYIIKNNQIQVSQYLLQYGVKYTENTEDFISFYATLGEAIPNTDEETVYKTIHGIT